MTKRKLPPPGPPKQGDSVYQSDLALNLFMVLLIAFAVIAAAAGIMATTGFKSRMTSEKSLQKPPLAIVGSWQPVQPVSPRIIIRDGVVLRLNLDRLAESVANGRRLLAPGVSQSAPISEDPDPSSYKISLVLLREPIPQEILAWQVPAARFVAGSSDAGALSQFEQDLQIHEQFDVFVYRGEEETAWDIAARLHQANKRYRLLFLDDPQYFDVSRESTRFAFEEMYK